MRPFGFRDRRHVRQPVLDQQVLFISGLSRRPHTLQNVDGQLLSLPGGAFFPPAGVSKFGE